MPRRAIRTALLATLLALFVAPSAHAWLLLGPDQTRGSGQIGFFVWGSGLFTKVDLTEQIGSSLVPVKTVKLKENDAADGTPFSGDFFNAVVPWRCDRLQRTFHAVGYRADGTTETADGDVRTPSCRNRLKLTTPRKTAVGSRVNVKLDDSFDLGDIATKLCVQPPGQAKACHTRSIPAGKTSATFHFRAHDRGQYKVSVSTSDQQLSSIVAAGVAPPSAKSQLPVVLATGDSLMQNVAAVLTDDLTGQAQLAADVKIGSGISKKFVFDWAKLPAQQIKADDPAATVVFLGTNEGWPMTTSTGKTVECCSAAWIVEYAARVRKMMKTYLKRGPVLWLNVPVSRDPALKAKHDAVNLGIAAAAKGLDGVMVLDMAALFTPGGVYRDTMVDNGKTVTVRESDGVHLSGPGAAIASRAVTAALKTLGVIPESP